jgi:SAM-dependent methyltransferase
MGDELDSRRARVFGATAEQYERTRPGYPREAVDWVVPPDARRVADVGAGTGKLTGMLIERGLAADAVEPDPAMLAVLTRQHPTAQAVLAGAEALALPDSSVDAVLVAQAWHWFPHQAAVAEARRVLRPGGWLGLLWNVDTATESWQRALEALSPDSAAADADDEGVELPGLTGLPVGANVSPGRRGSHRRLFATGWRRTQGSSCCLTSSASDDSMPAPSWLRTRHRG